jgi:hypothetical protein
MSAAKGIPLKDITGSPLARDRVEVDGLAGLHKLVTDNQAGPDQAQPARGPERTQIRITTWERNTEIDITLSSVADLPAALDAIGYCKRPGILQKLRGWLSGRATVTSLAENSRGNELNAGNRFSLRGDR